VTEVFIESAAREAAFRFVENEDISAAEIGAAAHRATGRRSAGLPFVYVPVDQTEVHVTDRSDSKSLGHCGTATSKTRGLQVMNAIAVAPDGTPMGLCGQVYWSRQAPQPRPKKDHRPVEERETACWLEAMEQTRSALAETKVRPWFQLDRAGDSWSILLDAHSSGSWLTVRSRFDRRLKTAKREPREYLWSQLERQAPMASYNLTVLGSASRKARTASMLLQSCEVTLDLQLWPSQRRTPMRVWAVRVLEVGTNPDGEEPIEWRLLTTRPVLTAEDAHEVVIGYATRWRIEEFHKVWKSSACRVEETQLHEPAHVERWATLLASVAIRLLRLMFLSRNHPQSPATVELTRAEIDAAILIRKPRGIRRGARVTISDVVRWIADLGGYTGKSSGGPPGAVVIARGLDHIQSAAVLLADGEL
jgi:hypothetical protein